MELREAGFTCRKRPDGPEPKAQMKHAGRLGASYVIIFGSEELQRARLLLRDMNERRTVGNSSG